MYRKLVIILSVAFLASCSDSNILSIPITSITVPQSDVTIIEGETLSIEVNVSPENYNERLFYSYSTIYLNVSMINHLITITGKKAGVSYITIKNEANNVSSSVKVTVIPKQYSINEPIRQDNSLSAIVEKVFHRRSTSGEILSDSSMFPGQLLLIAKIIFENNSSTSEYISSSYFGLLNGYHQIDTINFTYNNDTDGSPISTNVSQSMLPGSRYTMYVGFEPTAEELLLEDKFILKFDKYSLSFNVSFNTDEIE